MGFKLHHKIGAAVVAPAVAHHAISMAREHLFLIAHEVVSHMGWLAYTAIGAIVIVAPAGYYFFRRIGEEPENK